jgi:uncharacterized membrane protein YagU involved in acid resistance
LFDVFIFGEEIASGKPVGAVITGTWALVASTAFGPAMLTSPSAPAIGGVLHFAVSIAWAFGYVYLIRAQPQLLTRPWVSGFVFGIVVWVVMQAVLVGAGVYHRPSPPALLSEFVAHVLFFGIPIALIVARMLSGAPARA